MSAATCTTRVVEGVRFTPSMLVSTTAVNAHPDWVAGSYAKGEIRNREVVYAKGYLRGLPTIKKFESLVDDNTADPASDAEGQWLELTTVNTLAMFDNKTSTQTVGDGPLTVEVAPGRVCTTVALLNLVGTAVTLTVTEGEETTYTKTISLQEENVTDWFEYFTLPVEQTERVVFSGVPIYSNCSFTITIDGAAPRCGRVEFGRDFELGTSPSYGAMADRMNYSNTEPIGEFGEEEFVEDISSGFMSITLQVPKARVSAVIRLLDKLNGVPCLLIASEDVDYTAGLIQFGWFKSRPITIDHPTESTLNIDFGSLT